MSPKKNTTAFFRDKARDYEDKLQFDKAAKYYDKAVKAYPSFRPGSELSIADLNYLKKKRNENLNFFKK